MLRFAITDRRLGAVPDEGVAERNLRVAERAAALARQGVDYLLLREKDYDLLEALRLTWTADQNTKALSGLLPGARTRHGGQGALTVKAQEIRREPLREISPAVP